MEMAERPHTAGTVDRLRRWGTYLAKRVDHGLGYPRRAPFVTQRVDGDTAYDGMHLAADVAEVDAAVMACPPHITAALYFQFVRTGTQAEKAALLEVSRRVFQQRVEHGVDQVHWTLSCNRRTRRKLVDS